MQFHDFKRIVTCFADRVDDVDTSHGELLVQIRDETITARLHQLPRGLLVEEHGARMPATGWIVNRLARLPLLADRICSYVSPPEHFVPSSGRFLDRLDADPSGEDNLRSNVADAMTHALGRRPAGATSVLSALGNLVSKLRSAGTLLVAARKTYFDYPNFGSQARLFDTIGTDVEVGSGTLLTADEHHELLSMVAQEMWLSATDALAMDVVSLVVEMFAEGREKSPAVARQIHERIKQHSLLAVTRTGRTALAFDHEDFRVFYLGQGLGRALADRDEGTLKSIIDKAALPASTVAEAAGSVRRRGGDALGATLALLQSLADAVLPASFVRENCGVLTLALIDRDNGPHTIRNMSFPAGALRERRLTNVTVWGSYFPATGLNNTELDRCAFVKCHFERLEIDGSETVSHTSLDDVRRVDTVVRVRGNDRDPVTRFDPGQIRDEVIQAGFDVPSDPATEPDTDAEDCSDDDLVLVQRFLRAFLRATAVNENTVQQRLGVNASHFLGELLPRLQNAGVVQEVLYHGGGNQRRMRLSAPMSRIEEAMRASGGGFERFVREVQRDAA